MSCGTLIAKDGSLKSYGFAHVLDWFQSVLFSFPSPWSLPPREGKYYGTVIQDARGKDVLSFWLPEGEPSWREKARFGESWTAEAWADYISDQHWESEAALSLAQSVVIYRNRCLSWAFDREDESAQVLTEILKHGIWCDDVFAEIACGGPDRREPFRLSE